MKRLMDVPLYREDICYVSGLQLPWEKLENAKVLITGAGGLIGSFLIDTLMWRNDNAGIKCKFGESTAWQRGLSTPAILLSV